MQPQEHAHTPAPPPAFTLTDAVAARINALKYLEKKPGLRFRITVKGGGCSGFQYDFALDDSAPAADDVIFSHNNAEVIVDNVSLGIIGGSVLDYTEDLSSAGFSIKNPNATAKCGCGNSFAVTL